LDWVSDSNRDAAGRDPARIEAPATGDSVSLVASNPLRWHFCRSFCRGNSGLRIALRRKSPELWWLNLGTPKRDDLQKCLPTRRERFGLTHFSSRGRNCGSRNCGSGPFFRGGMNQLGNLVSLDTVRTIELSSKQEAKPRDYEQKCLSRHDVAGSKLMSPVAVDDERLYSALLTASNA
jgi:hypothetical protein